MSEDFASICAKCDEKCCNGIFILSQKEKDLLWKNGHGHHIKEKHNYCVFEGDPCPFFKEDKCSIHEIRPMVCRLWPLYIVVDEDGKLDFELEEDCPATKELGKEYFEKAKEKASRYIHEEVSIEAYQKFWEEEDEEAYC